MPIVKHLITPIEIDYVCDKCGEGVMRCKGLMLLSDPPKYPLVCTECGHEVISDMNYPIQQYIRQKLETKGTPENPIV